MFMILGVVICYAAAAMIVTGILLIWAWPLALIGIGVIAFFIGVACLEA